MFAIESSAKSILTLGCIQFQVFFGIHIFDHNLRQLDMENPYQALGQIGRYPEV